MKKILIIKSGKTYDDIKFDFGDFDDWIIEQTNLPDKLFDIYNITKGERLRHPDEYFAAIITGSHFNTSDKLPWIKRLKDWIIEAHYCNLPILGICFGHQLIAEALGGKVETNPSGLNAGVTNVNLINGASNDPLFKTVGTSFESYVFNNKSVSKQPYNAEILAESNEKMIYAYRVNKIYGVQFHPEFTEEIMDSYRLTTKKEEQTKIQIKLSKKHKNQSIIPNFLDSFLKI